MGFFACAQGCTTGFRVIYPRNPGKTVADGCLRLLANRGVVLRVAFHPKQLMLISAGEDAELRVWDLVDKSCVATLKARARLLGLDTWVWGFPVKLRCDSHGMLALALVGSPCWSRGRVSRL